MNSDLYQWKSRLENLLHFPIFTSNTRKNDCYWYHDCADIYITLFTKSQSSCHFKIESIHDSAINKHHR